MNRFWWSEFEESCTPLSAICFCRLGRATLSAHNQLLINLPLHKNGTIQMHNGLVYRYLRCTGRLCKKWVANKSLSGRLVEPRYP